MQLSCQHFCNLCKLNRNVLEYIFLNKVLLHMQMRKIYSLALIYFQSCKLMYLRAYNVYIIEILREICFNNVSIEKYNGVQLQWIWNPVLIPGASYINYGTPCFLIEFLNDTFPENNPDNIFKQKTWTYSVRKWSLNRYIFLDWEK